MTTATETAFPLEAGRGETGATVSDFALSSQSEYADDALALKFTDEHGANLTLHRALGPLEYLAGNVWRTDETLAVYDLTRNVCRVESEMCPKPSVLGQPFPRIHPAASAALPDPTRVMMRP